MATRTPLSEADARVFLADYAVGSLTAVRAIPAGTVNSSFALETERGRVFLRVYEEQDRSGAVAETTLLAHLEARGVPTPGPLRRRDGGLIGEVAGKPAALFPWREGRMRCLAAVTPQDTEKVGRTLAQLHRAGEGAEVGPGRFRPEDLARRLDRIEAAADPELARQAPPLRASLARWVSRRDPSLPRGVIHGDLFRDNVLWNDEGEIVALLDFESASEGAFAYDLAVTLLAWCFRSTLEEPLARALVRGYGAVRPLARQEEQGLLAEACIAALRFTITRITDEAMRAFEEKRPMRSDKDWHRFAARLDALEALGQVGLARITGLGG